MMHRTKDTDKYVYYTGVFDCDDHGMLQHVIRKVFYHMQKSELTYNFLKNDKTYSGYLNYPTQVIFKCCKLIPVMIGGIFIQNKVYNRFDYASVILMTIGLVFFTLGGQKVSPNFDLTGIPLISTEINAV